jgi:hypothetical protein
LKLARGLWRNRGALKREFGPLILALNMLRNYNYFGLTRAPQVVDRPSCPGKTQNMLNDLKRQVYPAPTTS